MKIPKSRKEKNQGFFSPSLFPKSRKGDIPTFILVIGVFLVCGLTVLSFGISFASVERSFDVLQNMASINSIADQVRFYENAGLEPKSFLDIKKKDNFYDLTLEQKEDEKRVFYVEYRISAKAQPSK